MNIKSYLSILFVTLVSLLLLTAKASGATWKTEVVDSGGSVGGFTSIALDSSDNVHIGYYDITIQDLKYATNATNSWVTETVDSGTAGADASIAIDSSDNVHISYLGFTIVGWGGITDLHLKYATNATNSWVTETVDSGESAGTNTSIAIDSSDNAHISYYDNFPNEDLKYATNATGSWVTEIVDSGGGLHTSIAIDSSGNVHISYWSGYFKRELKYATNTTGSWVTETVDSAGGYTSIAIDSSGNVHISYSDIDNWNLKYATNSTGSWVTVTVDKGSGLSDGMNTSIALDSSDNIHISYFDFDSEGLKGELKYATNAIGSWVTEIVDSGGGVGGFTSIALDSSDNVHISYLDGTNRYLKYATTNVLVPDIKANGLDGFVTPTGNLLVTVALDPASRSGENADWWVAADVSGTSTIDGWYYFDVGAMNWVYAGGSYTDLSPTYQGPLFDLSTFEVLNMPGLPVGTYIFYFAVDTNMNGVLDLGELFFDSVVVNITP